MTAERLQKILSAAGIASRRAAEQIILEGRVTVNGHKVRELGVKADITKDHVKVDGKLLHGPKHLVYLALHKPDAVMTTVTDPEGHATVMESDLAGQRTHMVDPAAGTSDYAYDLNGQTTLVKSAAPAGDSMR